MTATVTYIDPQVTFMAPDILNAPASYPTPAGLCTDIGYLGEVVNNTLPDVGPNTLVIPTWPGGFLDQLEGLGWEMLDGGRTGQAWTRLRRLHDMATVHIGVLDRMSDDPMFTQVRADRGHDTMAGLVDWWRTYHTPYWGGPGTAMTVAMNFRLTGGVRRRLQNQATTEWWRPPAPIHDLSWQAATDRKLSNVTLHRWDMRSAYLAAVAREQLPLKGLRNTGNFYEPDAVGYFRIVVHSGPVAGLGPTDRQGCLWVTHPTLNLLRERPRVWSLEVVDSWTSTDYGRPLAPWALRTRDALYGDPSPTLRAAIKAGYAQAIGMFDVPRGTIYRPDWRHIIMDGVRASMIRRIARVRELTGRDPAKIDVDSVWYHAADLDHLEHIHQAIGTGDLIGRMRYEGTGQFRGRRWVADS